MTLTFDIGLDDVMDTEPYGFFRWRQTSIDGYSRSWRHREITFTLSTLRSRSWTAAILDYLPTREFTVTLIPMLLSLLHSLQFE